MVYKDELCMWFKNNESHRRLELLCGLLNMCLPFELRFIRTCVEDLGKRDDLLRDFDSKANNSSEINQLGKVLDERTRSKFVVYIALLEANNQTCSKILFESLSNAQQIPNSALINNNDNINYIKEMLLIYTMVLNHPAFTFEEKRIIGDKLQSLQLVEEQINSSQKSWNRRTFEPDTNLTLDSCHPISSPQVLEACDSGLSIGTEPEVEILSERMCIHSSIQPLHISGNSSGDNKFADIIVSKDLKTTDRPMLNPSIGIKSSEKLPSSNFNGSASSNMSISPSTEDSKPCSSNRDASSSGSGESLDLYGENLSVPTTYIYNSNIYEQQNLTDMPAMALSNNVINFTPSYMYQHNGRCHFIQYPSMGGVMPSVPLPRKLSPPGTSSETSSSEEGGTSLVNSQPRETLLSPLSSSHSSPYASPPQSLTPSRASSPKEALTVVTSSHISHGLVTCTTTTIVISRSNQRPAISHSSSCSSTGSSNSQPSSPAFTSNSINRNKPPLLTQCQKYSSDRSYNLNSENLYFEGPICTNGPSCLELNKETSTNLYSSNDKNAVLSSNTPCNTIHNTKYCEKYSDSGVAHNSIPSCLSGQSIEKESIDKTDLPNIFPASSSLPSTTFVNTSSSNSCANSVGSPALQKGTPNCVHISPLKSNIKNIKEKQFSEQELIKVKCVEKETKGNNEKEMAFTTLPNGFNDDLLVSAAHSVPLKHSIVSTSSIPSCSFSHMSVPIVLQSESGKNIVANAANGMKHNISSPISNGTGNHHHLSVKSGHNKHFSVSEDLPLSNKCQSLKTHSSVSTTTATTIKATVSAPTLTKSLATSAGLMQLHPSNLQQQLSTTSLKDGNVPEYSIDECTSDDKIDSMVDKSSQPISSTSNATVVNMSSQHSTSMKTSPTNKYIVPTSGPLINISTNHQAVFKSSQADGRELFPSASPMTTSQVGSCAKSTAIGTAASTFPTSVTSTTSSIVSLVPTPAAYPPYLPLPVLPGGASSFISQGPYPPHIHGHHRNPSHAFILASPAGVIHGNSNHLMRNHPHIPPPSGTQKSRGSSGRSGSSSSSSSSGLSRKKGFIRGNQYQSKSRSSDSSPSSSQYSSPPQTPSPDHIKDVRSKPGGSKIGKSGEGYSAEEVWEPSDVNGHCLSNHGSREEGTPPPHAAMGAHIMIQSNPVRQRYIPYHPTLGFLGYAHPHSHHGMYRYPLPSPVVMGPRPPTPLSSEKSSRETTPPGHAIGHTEVPQKIIEYPPIAASSSSVSPSSYNMCAMVSAPSVGHSSTSPPIPGPMVESSSVTLVPPPPPAGHSGAPSGGMNSSMPHFNSPNYHMFAMGGNPFMTHLSGFMQPTSNMPNGYVSPHNLPPNYPVPSIPNGELVYPSPYPVMAQSTLPTSSCGGHPVLHQSSVTHPPPFSPYHNAPPPSNPVPPPNKKPYTCYNCGKGGHRGSECKEASIDEMTKRTKIL